MADNRKLEEGLDLREYWHILLRRWWIIVLCLAVGLGAAGVYAWWESNTRIPEYEATAKLLLQGGSASVVTGDTERATSQQLAQYYDDIVKTRSFLDRVASELSFSVEASGLASKIEVRKPRSLIEISARDRDPEQAAEIANITASTLAEDLRDRQLTQIAQIQAALSQYGIIQDPSVTAAQLANLTSLILSEDAQSPTAPFNLDTGTGTKLLIAGVLSLVIAGLLIYLLEKLDDSLKSPEELRALTGSTFLGSLRRFRNANGARPTLVGDPDAAAGMREPYKFIWASLEFATPETERLQTLLVTSAGPGEGKTTTTGNLGASMALQGHPVIIVDSDLRKPGLHHMFEKDNKKGLTTLLYNEASLDEVLLPTDVPGLSLLPSGPVPADPTIIFRSTAFKQLIDMLKTKADMVIFDSPPLLMVTDSVLMAARMDAVVLVVDAHQTKKSMIKRGWETLQQARPALAGTVLNKVSARSSGGYYYYYPYYQYDYYSREDGARPQSWRGRLLSRLARRHSRI